MWSSLCKRTKPAEISSTHSFAPVTCRVKDVDMVNALPTLLSQFCSKLEIACPLLDAYVKDREGYLQKLKMKRNVAKIQVLQILLGEALTIKGSWIEKFHKECMLVREAICLRFPATFVSLKNKQYSKASTVCREMQQIENSCLGALRDYATVSGLTTRVLVYDGIMLNGSLRYTWSGDASNYMLEKTGFRVELLEKPIDKMTVAEVLAKLKLPSTLAEVVTTTTEDTTNVFLGNGAFLNIMKNYISCKAAMMMGKTEETINLVRQFKDMDKTALFITQCVSMAYSSYERLQKAGMDFVHYKVQKGMLNSKDHKYVICEYETFSRIVGNYDLIVLDEWRSLIETIQSPTNSLKTIAHWEDMKRLAFHASKVLYLDADMECDGAAYRVQDMLCQHEATFHSDALTQTAKHLDQLIAESRSSTKIQQLTAQRDEVVLKAFHVANNPPKVHHIVSNVHKMKRCVVISTSIDMLDRAQKLLEEGQRIVLCCGSIKIAGIYAQYLERFAKGGYLHEYIDGCYEETETPSTGAGLYTSKAGEKKDLKTLQACWDKYQCISFTSTITTGVDYNTPIHTLFLMPWHNACTPRDKHQMAGRIRRLMTEDMYVAVSEEILVRATSRQRIDQGLKMN
jgi:Origin of replication binding protein